MLCDKLYRLHVRPEVASARFIGYALRTAEARTVIESEATGTSDSMKNIGQDTVKRLRIPAIPLSDQQAIVRSLDEIHRTLRRVASKLQLQIGFLHEKRQVLITATVTGQIAIPRGA